MADPQMAVKPVLRTKWHVIAYNESWGGYGDNASSDFDNEADAIAYAKGVAEHLKPARIVKKITMDPISIQVDFEP